METSVETRRDQIIRILKERGHARVSTLSRRLGVSEVAIRKDLACLEALGLLQRYHGGARRMGQGYLYEDLDERMNTRGEQKRRIARKARSLVRERQVVMLNSGSTNHYIARGLSDLDELVIVTNAIRVASELSRAPSVHPILLGGEVKERYQFTHGADALRQLRKYHADICFIAVDGIASDSGVTSYYHYEAEIIRQMMAQSEMTVVAADATKVGRASLESVGDIRSIDVLLTDASFPNEELDKIQAAGVQVLVA